MADEQEMELHEELKWAKIEAGQAHAMVASLQEKLRASAAENERLRANLYQEEADTEALETKLEAIAAENERLRGLIKEAIRLARQPHYGNMYLEIENFAEGISLLEGNLEESGK